jgi:hypothetical protein
MKAYWAKRRKQAKKLPIMPPHQDRTSLWISPTTAGHKLAR